MLVLYSFSNACPCTSLGTVRPKHRGVWEVRLSMPQSGCEGYGAILMMENRHKHDARARGEPGCLASQVTSQPTLIRVRMNIYDIRYPTTMARTGTDCRGNSSKSSEKVCTLSSMSPSRATLKPSFESISAVRLLSP